MKNSALLMGPDGANPTVLDAEEYETLASCLTVLRTDEAFAIARTLKWFRRAVVKESQSAPLEWLEEFLSYLLRSIDREGCEERGLLCGLNDEPIVFHEYGNGPENYRAVRSLAKLLKAGGWFARFLREQMRRYEQGRTVVTPLEIMSDLSAYVGRFERKLHTAKRMLQRYPELLNPQENVLQSGQEVNSATKE